MTINKRFWDRWAGWYDGAMSGSTELYGQIANRIKKSLSREMSVLELALAEIRRVQKPDGTLYAPHLYQRQGGRFPPAGGDHGFGRFQGVFRIVRRGI